MIAPPSKGTPKRRGPDRTRRVRRQSKGTVERFIQRFAFGQFAHPQPKGTHDRGTLNPALGCPLASKVSGCAKPVPVDRRSQSASWAAGVRQSEYTPPQGKGLSFTDIAKKGEDRDLGH